jgi:hypothetical protein
MEEIPINWVHKLVKTPLTVVERSTTGFLCVQEESK